MTGNINILLLSPPYYVCEFRSQILIYYDAHLLLTSSTVIVVVRALHDVSSNGNWFGERERERERDTARHRGRREKARDVNPVVSVGTVSTWPLQASHAKRSLRPAYKCAYVTIGGERGGVSPTGLFFPDHPTYAIPSKDQRKIDKVFRLLFFSLSVLCFIIPLVGIQITIAIGKHQNCKRIAHSFSRSFFIIFLSYYHDWSVVSYFSGMKTLVFGNYNSRCKIYDAPTIRWFIFFSICDNK